MKIFNFDSIDSTQDYLCEYLSSKNESEPILVTAKSQKKGKGRGENTWEDFEIPLAASLLIKPNKNNLLTSLEIGILVSDFLLEHFNQKTSLKWPNDIFLQEKKKCGGILINVFNSFYICGIGLNFSTNKSNHQYGSILVNSFNNLEVSKSMYNYILNHRISSPEKVIERWNLLCIHLNQVVEISGANNLDRGNFLGINENGFAILQTNNHQKIFSSGSLKIIN